MYIIASTRGEKKKVSTELKYLCDQARPVVTIGQTLAHRHEELRQSTPLECDAFCLDRNNELTTWDFTLVQAWRSYQNEIQSIKPRVKVWFTFYDVRDLHWKTIRGKTKLTRKVKLRTVEFLVAGKAHRATFWSTSGFKKKKKSSDACRFSTEWDITVAATLPLHKDTTTDGTVCLYINICIA